MNFLWFSLLHNLNVINPDDKKKKIPLITEISYPSVFVKGRLVRKRLIIIKAKIKNLGRFKSMPIDPIFKLIFRCWHTFNIGA